MLAGRMKLNTFVLLVALASLLAGGVCAGVGVWFAMRPAPVAPVVTMAPAPTLPAPVASTPAVATPAPAPVPVPAGGREVDTVVLSYVGKDIGTDKLKDVTSGKPFKVNVYQDSGKSTANRAKADLDRDDKWDEKFTFEDGTITRDVAPGDDESYTDHFRWNGSDWVKQ